MRRQLNYLRFSNLLAMKVFSDRVDDAEYNNETNDIDFAVNICKINVYDETTLFTVVLMTIFLTGSLADFV